MRQRQVSGVSVTESFRLQVQRKDGLRGRWYNTDPAFKERVGEITETQVDFVESKLMQSINANDTTAIIFYLKTKGNTPPN